MVDFRNRLVRNRQHELGSLDYDSFRQVIYESLTSNRWSLEAGSGLSRYVTYLRARGFASVGIEISGEIAKKGQHTISGKRLQSGFSYHNSIPQVSVKLEAKHVIP